MSWFSKVEAVGFLARMTSLVPALECQQCVWSTPHQRWSFSLSSDSVSACALFWTIRKQGLRQDWQPIFYLGMLATLESPWQLIKVTDTIFLFYREVNWDLTKWVKSRWFPGLLDTPVTAVFRQPSEKQRVFHPHLVLTEADYRMIYENFFSSSLLSMI